MSHELKQRSARVPWKAIAGTRGVLIHQCFGVDIKAVWQFVQQDLPELSKEIETLLQKK